jgi:uncharacterized OB-fold protein
MKHEAPRMHEAAPMWRAAAEGRLVLPFCTACARYVWPPRVGCAACAGALEWREAGGGAVLVSYSVVRRAVDPALKDSVPYVVAIVALDEGIRLFTNIEDAPVDRLRIGMRLRCSFESAVDGTTWLPVFTPEG